MLMRNFYKQLAFGLIAATSPLAIQAQQAEKTDTIYKQTFDPRGSINTMTVENMDGGKGTWNEEVNGGNYYAYNVISNNVDINSNVGIDANDWLITPEVELEANRLYTVAYKTFSYGAQYDDEWVEKGHKNVVDVLMGQDNDYSAYKSIISDPTIKRTSTFTENKAYVRNRTAGKYRFAFNDRSSFGCFPTGLDDIFIIKGPVLQAPDSVKTFTVTAAGKGAKEATVSFTTPTHDLEDNALASITKVCLLRDGKLIKTFDAPQTGQALSYVDADTEMANGFHTYTLFAVNASGDGVRTERKVYIGEDVPTAPTGGETTDMGDKIRLSWTAPTKGANGYYINPEALKYNIYINQGYGNNKLVARNVSATSYDIDNTFEGEQDETDFRVAAVSVAGEGSKLMLPEVITGTPYELPFAESFAYGRTEKFWWRTTAGDYELSEFKFASFDRNETGALPGSDDDYAFAVFSPLDDHETVDLCTGKISLKGTTQPTLKFSYAFSLSPMPAFVQAVVQPAGKKDQVLATYLVDQTVAPGVYTNVTLDLSQFKDEKYVFVKFRATSSPNRDVYIDNVLINDGDHNLDLSAKLTTVSEMTGGEKTNVNVNVSNLGKQKVSRYTVELLEDGEVVESVEQPMLKSMKSRKATISYKAPTDKKQVTLTAKVLIEGDENPANNVSAPVTISLTEPVLARPTDLKAQNTTQGAQLLWTAPDSKSENVVEGFETYAPFDTRTDNIGPWQLIDGDQSWTQGIPLHDGDLHTVATYPGNVQEEAFAWMVFDPTLTTPNLEEYYADGQFTPHGGKQYVIVACAVDIATTATSNDDWLISPLLTGEQQTVSLWAMSPSQMQENFDILVSSRTDDTDDFTVLKSDVTGTVKDSWKQYTYVLPEGTKYFAVRYSSSDEFMMGVDDIAYATGDGTLKGYNIYRDGKLLTTTDAATTSYNDASATAEEHTYTVTAVYSRGESCPSNAAGKLTGISNIDADNNIDTTPTQVYDLSGRAVNKASQRGVFIFKTKKGAVKVVKK